jgi:lipid-binding SYLF domain-containing protein
VNYSAKIFVALAALAAFLNGCSTEPVSVADRDALRDDVNAALSDMYSQDATLQPFLSRAAGYALFPTVGKGALGIGGAYGHGMVFEHGQFVGYTDLSQGTIGVQIGGQTFNEVIAFQDADALGRFEGGRFTFAANGSVVLIKAGAAGSAAYEDGVTVFVDPIGGLMLEAAIGGQSFSYQPK